jgi:hypothetical protein
VIFNDEGELELALGQLGYVSAPDAEPEATDVEPDVEDVPPPVADTGQGPVTDTGFIAGQAVFQASISGVAQTVPLRAAAGAGSGSITFDGDTHTGAFVASGHFADSDLRVVSGSFNDDAGLIGIAGEDDSGQSAAIFITHVTDAHSDGILYLGRWTDGTVTAFSSEGFSESTQLSPADNAHYVVAQGAVNLPGTGSALYDFNGMATSSTGTDGSIGRGIVAGHAHVFFGINEVSSEFMVDHEGLIEVHTNGFFDAGGPSFVTTGSATGAGCSPHCSASADGFLAGQASTPERLGLAYQIEQATRSIVGVGGFSHSPSP